jgi:DNA-binding MarR family transcriptional regulator
LAEDAFKITGLSPSYGYLMLILIDEPGLSQSELSQKMNLKASTMTRFIDKLIVLQYVE